MRREWIEIIGALCKLSNYMSPSMRREWIEILAPQLLRLELWSPSMRREWIEMVLGLRPSWTLSGLPPCGGSGLKWEFPPPSPKRRPVSLHAEGVD